MTAHMRGPARCPVYLDGPTHRDLRTVAARLGCSLGAAVRRLLDEQPARRAMLADLAIEEEVPRATQP